MYSERETDIHIVACIVIVYITEVNECVLSTHNCDTNAVCTDTVDSYTCKCISGFTGNGFKCTGRKLISL